MAIFMVMSTADSGAGSLRRAIADAEALGGTNTVTFDPGLSGATIALSSALTLNGAGTLTIDGDLGDDGLADVTLDGQDSTQVISVLSGDVYLDGLVLTGGNTGGNGGGLYIDHIAAATLVNTQVTNNRADRGGGVYANGTLEILGSVIEQNTADDRYGGLAIFGAAVISGSLIAENTSNNRGGAGLYVEGPGADLSLVNSTVWGNVALGGGQDEGGGIRIEDSAIAEIVHSTITGNAAKEGGGIYATGGSLVTVANSIVLGNWGRDAGQPDDITTSSQGGGSPDLNFAGVNIIGAGPAGGADLTGLSPDMVFAATTGIPDEGGGFSAGALADNGGALLSVAILANGPAHDGGLSTERPADRFDQDNDADTSDPLPFDTRSEGFARQAEDEVDIGSFEFLYSGPRLSFEAGLADGTETVTLSPTAVAGASVYDVNANDGEGGQTDASVRYSIVAGNTSLDGDGILPFAIDPLTGLITVSDPGDIDRPSDVNFDLTVRVSSAGATAKPSEDAVLTVAVATRPFALTVDTAIDEDDGDYSAGDLSLREAVSLIGDGGVITFDSSLAGAPLNLSEGQLNATRQMRIDGDTDGDGTPDIALIAGPNARLVEIASTSGAVELRSLQMSGGNLVSAFENGGAILSRSQLAVVNSYILDNSTAGIGGAIHAEATLDVVNSTLSGNAAQRGGAISGLNDGSAFFGSNDVTFSLVQATLAGNLAQENAAIFLRSTATSAFDTTELSIDSSTIVGNVAPVDSADLFVSGVLRQFNGSTFPTLNVNTHIENSVISGQGAFTSSLDLELSNSGLGARNSFFSGQVTGVEGNLPFLDTVVQGGDPLLGTIQDNGGPGPTLEPLLGSALINAGDQNWLPGDRLDVDADGNTSEQIDTDATGAARIASVGLDIGAVEVSSFDPSYLVVGTLSDVVDGDYSPANLSLREALSLVVDGGTVTFAPELAGGTLTLTGGQLNVRSGITIDGNIAGGGGPDITLDANGQSRVLQMGQYSAINGLIVTGGLETNDAVTASGFGGGIFASGRGVSISNSVIRDNAVSTLSNFAKGAGIYAPEGDLTVANTTLTGNTAHALTSLANWTYAQGGGI